MILITIRTQFVAQHRWVGAPDEVAFLRSFHQHTFHVKVSVRVDNCDRQVEFYIFKKQVDQYLQDNFAGRELECSCEYIAQSIKNRFDAWSVTVRENDENESTVCEPAGDDGR